MRLPNPHRDFGIDLNISVAASAQNDQAPSIQPVLARNPAILYGLGNLVENAVDFADDRVDINAGWNEETVWIIINDDGAGFSAEMLNHIGDPYVTTRNRDDNPTGGGLGLGLFIAKTLLERSGAVLEFTSRAGQHPQDKSLKGAWIKVSWPLEVLRAQVSVLKSRNIGDNA